MKDFDSKLLFKDIEAFLKTPSKPANIPPQTPKGLNSHVSMQSMGLRETHFDQEPRPENWDELFITNVSKEDGGSDNALYRSFKFMGYSIDITENAVGSDGKPNPNSLEVKAKDIETLKRIQVITGFIDSVDIPQILFMTSIGFTREIFTYLTNPELYQKEHRNSRPQDEFFLLNTPQYKGVLEKCFMASVEKSRKSSARIGIEISSPEEQQLYEELKAQGIRAIDPEGMGLIYAGLIKRYQEAHPEALPTLSEENQQNS